MNAPFIVIDGTDGSGKATQTKLLVDRLNREGHAAEQISFPSYGKPEAFFVEQYLNGYYGASGDVSSKKASLFYALDRFHNSQKIRDLLSQGTILVSDRYVSANKGHQTAKIANPAERKAFIAWLNELEYDILGIPVPDLTILLHVPSKIAYDLIAKKDERSYLKGKPRDIHEADPEHLNAAEQAYLELPTVDDKERWMIVECVEHEKLLSIEDIHERLWSVVKEKVMAQ